MNSASRKSRRIIRGRTTTKKAKVLKDPKSTNARKISSSSRSTRPVNKTWYSVSKDNMVSPDNSRKRGSESKDDSRSDYILPTRPSRRVARKSQRSLINITAPESKISTNDERNSHNNVPSTDTVNNNVCNNAPIDNSTKKKQSKYLISGTVDLVGHKELFISEA